MNFYEASQLADRILSEVSPFCEKISVAGKIRRKDEFGEVSRLIFVAKPSPQKLVGLMKLIQTYGRVVPSDQRCGTITIKSSGVFTNLTEIVFHWATDGQFGGLLFAHTGPDRYVEKADSYWIKRGGGGIVRGFAVKGGKAIPANTEEEFFKILGAKWQPPEKRF